MLSAAAYWYAQRPLSCARGQGSMGKSGGGIRGQAMTERGAGAETGLGRAALTMGLIYWAGVFAFSSILWGIVGTNPLASAIGKLIHYILCAPLTLGMAAALFWLHSRLRRRGEVPLEGLLRLALTWLPPDLVGGAPLAMSCRSFSRMAAPTAGSS